MSTKIAANDSYWYFEILSPRVQNARSNIFIAYKKPGITMNIQTLLALLCMWMDGDKQGYSIFMVYVIFSAME